MARRSKTRTHLPNGLLCSYPNGWAPMSNTSLKHCSPGHEHSGHLRGTTWKGMEGMRLFSRYVPEEVQCGG